MHSIARDNNYISRFLAMPNNVFFALLAAVACVGYFVLLHVGLVRLTLLAVGACICYVLRRRLRSKLLLLCAKGKTDTNIGFREKFKREFTFLKEKNAKGNEIDYLNVRHLAEKSIEKFIIKNELNPYSFSSSTTKATDTVDCHLIYSHRDLDMPYSCNAIGREHVLYMMDVNYSHDLEDWLWKGRPILLYSFCPTSVGGDCLEGTFTIEDDKITTVYKNDKIYHHQAFDFNMESFVIKGVLFSLMVTVDQFVSPMDPNRRVVCLTPTSWCYSVFNLILDNHPNELRRMRYLYGNGNILMSLNKAKNNQTVPYVSIGYTGEPELLRLDYDELLTTCKSVLSIPADELKYENIKNLLSNGRLSAFALMIFTIIKTGWLKTKNSILTCIKLPETGRIDVELE